MISEIESLQQFGIGNVAQLFSDQIVYCVGHKCVVVHLAHYSRVVAQLLDNSTFEVFR